MHAPTTAFLVDAIISRYIHNHQGSLPAPFSDRPIWVGASVREWKFLETMNVIIWHLDSSGRGCLPVFCAPTM